MAWSQKFPLTPAHQIPCIFFQAPRFQLWTAVESHWLLAVSCWLHCRGGTKLQAALQRCKKWCYFIVIIVLQNVLATYFCIDYENPLYPALQWPGSHEFGRRVKTFGYPSSSTGATNVVPVGTRSPEGPCKSPVCDVTKWRHSPVSNQPFGEVCWHNMHIFLYIHSSYFMCQCTEYKLLELQVRLSEENTYTRRYDTAVRNCKKYQAAR